MATAASVPAAGTTTTKKKNDGTITALEKDFNIERMLPKDFIDIYKIRKPMNVRVHKQDCRITNVLPESNLQGKAFVGDYIVAVDDKPISTGDDLNVKMKEKSDTAILQLRRNMYSWCFHLRTTVEKIQIDKEVERITPNPVNLYYVLIKVHPTPEMQEIDLGLFVMYNSRDRLEVEHVTANSLAAIHLKPGDVIRECNSQPICSKSMLRYQIASSIFSVGEFSLIVEAPIRDIVRDHIEIPEDVKYITDKAAEEFKKEMREYVPQLKKKTDPKKKIKLKEERTEHHIISDIDASKLRPCKHAN